VGLAEDCGITRSIIGMRARIYTIEKIGIRDESNLDT
jgi:hypothetical protein